MKTVLVLSAHLDDAAFSVGPLLAELKAKSRVVVATFFTKSIDNPLGFALACQLDKGLAASADYMKIRRQEDTEWGQVIGVEPVHGPFAEAPHRGYHSAKNLFGPILLTDEMEVSLTVWLNNLIKCINPEIILTPLGVGNHVDHQWVRRVAENCILSQHHLIYYQDQPYTSKLMLATQGTHLENVVQDHPIESLISEDSIECAIVAAAAYVTQIPFQFGDSKSMGQILRSAWGRKLMLFHTSELTSGFNILT